MSQLTQTAISTSTITASASGLTRTSNVVTVVVTGAPATPFATGLKVNIVGSTAVLGNNFNGTFTITNIVSTTSFKYNQAAPNDTGGGGTATVLAAAFTDLADSSLVGGSTLTQADMYAINENAKYGMIRKESFTLGFYAAGNVVPAPVSPVDGYQYAYNECIFVPIFVSSRQPASGFVPGQATFPTLANSDIGTGALLIVPYTFYIDRATGLVFMESYFNGNGAQAQGTAEVICHAQRDSVNA
jgi:hypothetical protein